MIKNHVDILSDLHTVDRYVEFKIGHLMGLSAVISSNLHNGIAAFSGVFSRIEDIGKIAAPGNTDHDVAGGRPQRHFPHFP